MEFSGRLTSFPIADLLQWAQNERWTGSLVLRRSTREKRIYFEDGRIVGCLSDQPAEYFGQHLLLEGFLDQDGLVDCLVRCRDTDRRLGVVLVLEEVLGLAEVQKTLRQHIENLVCDVFLWRHGIFLFSSEPAPTEDILAEPIESIALALKGTQWRDTHAQIRKVFPHDDVVPDRRSQAIDGRPADGLTASLGVRSRTILAEIDGERTLAQIYDKVRGAYFLFLQAAWELQQAGLIQVTKVRTHGASASLDIPFQELLIEQAAEEQAQKVRDFVSSPFGLFRHYVPVWIRLLPTDDWKSQPRRLQAFANKIDGTRRLGEIFSEFSEDWDSEADFLMEQIGKSRLALLPQPLPELEAVAECERTAEQERWWREIFGPAPV